MHPLGYTIWEPSQKSITNETCNLIQATTLEVGPVLAHTQCEGMEIRLFLRDTLRSHFFHMDPSWTDLDWNNIDDWGLWFAEEQLDTPTFDIND